MSKTLHQFGWVLFDELEQVAVRRGGFASLKWVEQELLEAQRGLEELGETSAGPTVARRATDALALAARTAEAVDQFGQIMRDRVKMARDVQKMVDALDQTASLPLQHAESCQKAPEALKQSKKIIQEEIKKVTRGTAVPRLADLTSALRTVVGEFATVNEAFQCIAHEKKRFVVDRGGRVAKQPAASRYEIYEVVETAARKSALLMETVGLAFSGGGIRSATFNLGFLQGAARLGLLKHFDYLSTVSGGGYIGAWFAAWVLREGGCEPEPPTDVAVKMRLTSQSLENVQKQLCSSRARQAEAVRGWVPPAKTRECREATVPRHPQNQWRKSPSQFIISAPTATTSPPNSVCRQSTRGQWFRFTCATFSSTISSCCRSCWP